MIIKNINNKLFQKNKEVNLKKQKKFQSCINLTNNKKLNGNHSQKIIDKNINEINTSIIKNCVFNNNISYTQRNKKIAHIPFCIKIDKNNNSNKEIHLNKNDNQNIISINHIDSTSNNIINSKNLSDNETQMSTNNNLNNRNQDY